ncbi:MAG: ABC transporter permease subunit [Acidimicrobiia bacterium]|nr:ABC transporter permease subunit [Acidimicrobiia bacterium]
MTQTVEPKAAHERPPLWRDATVLKWAAQIAVLLGLIFVGVVAVRSAAANLEAQGLTFSWRFLSDAPGIQLSEGFATLPSSGLEAILVGVVNMLRVTASGVVAATILGVIVGIARLSSNWLVNKASTVYVETIRNVPLLLQIVFWFAVFGSLPSLESEGSGPIEGWLYATNKGLSIPWFFPREAFWQWFVFVLAGAIAARFAFRWRIRVLEETGHEAHAVGYSLAAFMLFAVVGWFAHPIAGALGWVFGGLSWLFGSVPLVLMQFVLAVAVVGLAARWIKRFLDSLRSPAGLARLTDDDIFRIGLAGAMGVVAAIVFFLVPGITEGINLGLERLFGFWDGKFDFLRTGTVLEFGRPTVEAPGRFASFGATGMTMSGYFFGVWVGVTLYTAAFIAEIVRGGILAVAKGQTEAGLALGLKRSQLLRMIVLPQAFRIILPPMGNQYLNLAKNTSLGIAVGYAEVVAVGQTLFNQTGATIQVILIWMGFYLLVSLMLSAIVNWYNRRVALVER